MGQPLQQRKERPSNRAVKMEHLCLRRNSHFPWGLLEMREPFRCTGIISYSELSGSCDGYGILGQRFCCLLSKCVSVFQLRLSLLCGSDALSRLLINTVNGFICCFHLFWYKACWFLTVWGHFPKSVTRTVCSAIRQSSKVHLLQLQKTIHSASQCAFLVLLI